MNKIVKTQLVRKWYYTAAGSFLCLIIIYFVSHWIFGGAEVVKLSKQEISDVNLILFGSVDTLDVNTEGVTKTTALQVPDEAEGLHRLRKQAVYRYIFSTRKPVSEADHREFVKYFNSFDLQQFAVVLSNYPIKSKSYFWLLPPGIYLEVVFWSLFGLLASLFYYVSESIRKETFKASEIGVHVAKVFYTPLSALIIFFSITLLSKSGDIVVSEYGNGSLVLAFILGFFSGRTIELLGKIKDLILPVGKPKQDEPEEASAPEEQRQETVSAFSSLTLDEQDALIQEYIDTSFEQLKARHPNLTGINSERKKLQGRASDMLCITFQVSHKDDNAHPQFDKVVTFKGYHIPTDVQEHAVTEPAGAIVPLEGGISRASHADFGTIGIPVTDVEGNNLIMSCYHVLFNIELNNGTFEVGRHHTISNAHVISPHAKAGGAATDTVGKLVEGKIDQWLDIAVFKPDENRPLDNKFSKVPGPFGVYELTRDDENKASVQFWGSGAKKACAKTVQNIFSNQWISYKVNGAAREHFIKGLIQLEGPVYGGDSGSAVFDGAGNYVGTIIGCDNKSTYMISARTVAVKTNYKIKTV